MYIEFYESVFSQGGDVNGTIAYAHVNALLLQTADKLVPSQHDDETHEFTSQHPWRLRVELAIRPSGSARHGGHSLKTPDGVVPDTPAADPPESPFSAPFYVLDIGHGLRTETIEKFKAANPPMLEVDYESNGSIVDSLLVDRFYDDSEANRPVLQTRQSGYIHQYAGVIRVYCAGPQLTDYAPTSRRILAAYATATAKALKKSFPTHHIHVDNAKLKTF